MSPCLLETLMQMRQFPLHEGLDLASAPQGHAIRKPGLFSHYLGMEQIRAGSQVHDFIARGAPHKKSLVTKDLCLAWIASQRDRLGFRRDEALRRLKRRWLA